MENMDKTRRLLLLIAGSCLAGAGPNLALGQSSNSTPALTNEVQEALRFVPQTEAVSARDLVHGGYSDLAGANQADVQAALNYLINTGFLRRTGDGKYYSQETTGG
jgi:hypothetical protein